MALDQGQAEAAARGKRAQLKAEPAASPAGGSTLKGFLWGLGSVGAIALLLYLATQSSVRRPTDEGPAGGGPAPAEMAQNDPDVARLKAAVEKNPQDLETRLELARRLLLRDDMMGTFTETKAVLARRPEVRVIILAINPSRSRWKFWPEVQKTNRLVQEFCHGNPRLIFADFSALFLGADGRPDSSLFLKDELHLNAEGYAVWTQALAPVLRKVLASSPSRPTR